MKPKLSDHPDACICLACRNARTVAHGRELGLIPNEADRLPSVELRGAIKLQRAISSAAEATREMAMRLINRDDQLYTTDAARLASVAMKLEEVAADLDGLTSR
jgi:muramidase (phage lysozyme)